jgi:hypothetical protein
LARTVIRCERHSALGHLNIPRLRVIRAEITEAINDFSEQTGEMPDSKPQISNFQIVQISCILEFSFETLENPASGQRFLDSAHANNWPYRLAHFRGVVNRSGHGSPVALFRLRF